MSRTAKREMQELGKLFDLYMPWVWASVERIACEVTLRTGKVVTLAIPLGAAVEIEEAGWGSRIRVVGPLC